MEAGRREGEGRKEGIHTLLFGQMFKPNAVKHPPPRSPSHPLSLEWWYLIPELSRRGEDRSPCLVCCPLQFDSNRYLTDDYEY